MKNNEGKEKAIMLMGNSGVGKTTLAHWLKGTKLKATQYNVDGFDAPLEEIGHRQSKTTIPNKYFINDELVILDCPSFMTYSGKRSQEVVNSFHTKQLFSQYEQMKFVLVVHEASTTSERGKSFIQAIKQFCDSFTDIELVKDSVSLVVTQTEPGKIHVFNYHLENLTDLQVIINKLPIGEEDCAPKVLKMLSYLKKNIMFFDNPNYYHKEIDQNNPIELPKCDLLENIDKFCKYADTTKDIGKYNVCHETIYSFLKSYQEKDFEMLELLVKMGVDLNAIYYNLNAPYYGNLVNKNTMLVHLLKKDKIDIDAIELLLANGANLPNTEELNETQTNLINKYIPLISSADSLLDVTLDNNQLCKDFIINCGNSEEFIESNIKFIKDKITNKICKAGNVKDLIKWTGNLEKNLDILQNQKLDELCELAKELCVFGGDNRIESLTLKTLEKMISKDGLEITKEQFKQLQYLLGSKLKFVAVENMLNSIKILPQKQAEEIIEIVSIINFDQSEDQEVEIVDLNFEEDN